MYACRGKLISSLEQKKGSYMKKGKKLVGLVTSAALASSLVGVAPIAAFAAGGEWQVPTSPSSMTVTQDGKTSRYVKGAAIYGSFVANEYLGICNVMDRDNDTVFSAGNGQDGKYASNPALGIWGTAVNQNADPMVANVLYNYYADANNISTKADEAVFDIVAFEDGKGGSFEQGNGCIYGDTTNVDLYGVSTTMSLRPDMITLRPDRVAAFADQVKTINEFSTDSEHYKAKSDTYVGDEKYNPAIGQYETRVSMYSLVESLYSVAEASQQAIDYAADNGVTLMTRYGDPQEIAQTVETLIRGTQGYILANIEAGNVERKTVAFVDSMTDNDHILIRGNVDPASYFGGNTHMLEPLVATSDNLANKIDPDLDGGAREKDDEGKWVDQGTVTVTAAQLAEADVVMVAYPDNMAPNFAGAHNAQTLAGQLQAALASVDSPLADKPIFNCMPQATTGMGQMHIDTLLCTIVGAGFVYPEIVDPMQMLAYWYENVYHVKADSLKTALTITTKDTVTLPAGADFDASLSNYNSDTIKGIVESGIGYIKGSAKVAEDYPYLKATEALDEIPAKTVEDFKDQGIAMYRLYNPNSGEHFYTSSTVERDATVDAGWNFEKIEWYAPEKSSTPVYRLYNPNFPGEHHYTMDAGERDILVGLGWIFESKDYNEDGAAWYSDDAQGTPLYRQYNPNEYANNHNYTTDRGEHESLIGMGWNDEGLAWYGIAK